MRAGRSPNTVVVCYTLEGELIKIYPSAKRAALSLHLHSRTIDKAIREAKIIRGKIWKRFPAAEVPNKVEPFNKPTISLNPKPIGLLNENNRVIKAYPSVKKAAIDNGVDPHTIRDMLYGKTKTAKGKKYRYINDEEAFAFGIVINRDKEKVKIRQYSLSGKLIKIHSSIGEAARSVNVDRSSITYCIRKNGKTVKGYYWIIDDNKAEEKLAKLMGRKTFFYTTIIQLDKTGKIIAKYCSTKEASLATGIKGKTIAQSIRNKSTAGDYYWKGKK